MIILWTGVTLALQLIAEVDKFMNKKRKEQDEALYDYCLNRLLIICPYCRIGFEVEDLAQQMNVEWQCACCGNHFVEYGTHTR